MKTRGFTLVEVLVALVIVAVGMAAVLGAMSATADNTRYLRDKTLAQWVGLNRIAEVRLTGRVPAEGKTKGESEMAGRKWRWEQEVLETEVPGMVRIDVKVQSPDAPPTQTESWLVTVSGIMGDAVSTPMPLNPVWDKMPSQTPGGGDGGDEQSGDNGQRPNDPGSEQTPSSSSGTAAPPIGN